MKARIVVKSICEFTPRDKPYEVTDNGLVLRIQPSGVATFYAVFRIDGKNSRYRIGKAGLFTKKNNGTYSFKSVIHPDVARSVLKEKAGEAAGGKNPQEERKRIRSEKKAAKSKTVGGFFKLHYKPWLEVERKSGKATAKRIESCFKWLFDKPMMEITPFLIQGWQRKRLKAGRSPHTVNRDMVALKAMLSKAVEWSFLDKSPLLNMKRAKAADNSRVRYLSHDEEKRLFTALEKRESNGREARSRFNEWRRQRHLEPLLEKTDGDFIDHLQPIVLLALNTGLRRGEIFNLEWSDIDFLHNRLTVRAASAKGAKTRHLPLNSTALTVLKRWHRQNRDTGLVFPGKKGARLDNISRAWRKLVAKAEIEDLTFHDLRHDFATKTLKAGADIVTVSKLLGHSDLKMTLRYSHVTDEALTTAVERLSVNV